VGVTRILPQNPKELLPAMSDDNGGGEQYREELDDSDVSREICIQAAKLLKVRIEQLKLQYMSSAYNATLLRSIVDLQSEMQKEVWKANCYAADMGCHNRPTLTSTHLESAPQHPGAPWCILM